jgi:hypothetical protein
MKSYPDGTDCLWLALDRDGHVGAFTTGGSGPIPLGLLQGGQCPLDGLEARIVELPHTSTARLLVSMPRPDDFVDLAERGIFAYDWTDVHRTARDEIGAYELIAVPSDPIKVGQLPQGIALLAASSKLQDVTFETATSLDVRRSLRCVSR